MSSLPRSAKVLDGRETAQAMSREMRLDLMRDASTIALPRLKSVDERSLAAQPQQLN